MDADDQWSFTENHTAFVGYSRHRGLFGPILDDVPANLFLYSRSIEDLADKIQREHDLAVVNHYPAPWVLMSQVLDVPLAPPVGGPENMLLGYAGNEELVLEVEGPWNFIATYTLYVGYLRHRGLFNGILNDPEAGIFLNNLTDLDLFEKIVADHLAAVANHEPAPWVLMNLVQPVPMVQPLGFLENMLWGYRAHIHGNVHPVPQLVDVDAVDLDEQNVEADNEQGNIAVANNGHLNVAEANNGDGNLPNGGNLGAGNANVNLGAGNANGALNNNDALNNNNNNNGA